MDAPKKAGTVQDPNTTSGPAPAKSAEPTGEPIYDWVMLTDKGVHWLGDESHPAAKKLRELSEAEKQSLTCIAFSPWGDWAILAGDKGYWASDAHSDWSKKLRELRKGHTLKWITFEPKEYGEAWVVLYDRNGWATSWGKDSVFFADLDEIAKSGGALQSFNFLQPVRFGWNWLTRYDDGAVGLKGKNTLGNPLPPRSPVLNAVIDKGEAIDCLCTPFASQLLIRANGGWKYSPELENDAKWLAKLLREGEKVKCVAAVHSGRCVMDKFGGGPTRVKAVLTMEFTAPGATGWLLYAPKPPTLEGRQVVESKFTPEAKVVVEKGPFQRSLYQSFVNTPTRTIKATLTMEATLYPRRLRFVLPHEKVPEVADLTPTEVRVYTQPTKQIDFNSKVVRNWLDREQLWRGPEESEMAFGRRAYRTLASRLTYDLDTLDRFSRASQVCESRRGVCWTFSLLYAAVMRANRIPARVLSVRQNPSGGDPDPRLKKYPGAHAIAEFFARGVGWVPVDLTYDTPDKADVAIVRSRESSGFRGYAGNDSIIMSLDDDVVVDFLGGPSTTPGGIDRPYAQMVPSGGYNYSRKETLTWEVK